MWKHSTSASVLSGEAAKLLTTDLHRLRSPGGARSTKPTTSCTSSSSLLALVLTLHLPAQTPTFPRGDLAPNVHHTGDVWLYSVSRADSTFDYNVTQATSAAGSRLDWHLHPDGQQLLITDGVGYYQERGGPLRLMRKGDVIKSAPGVEHWHAATPDSGVVYLAIYGGGRHRVVGAGERGGLLTWSGR